ncbi:MAG: TorF family putative porin [Hyphomicrobium sp.]
MPSLKFSGVVAMTSDYVYRGVSLRDEKPSALAMGNVSYGLFYLSAAAVGIDLGRDSLDRPIGNVEFDLKTGITPSFGPLDLNLGVQAYTFPHGRDVEAGTLLRSERDFVELFLRASTSFDTVTVGANVAWTQQFYQDGGQVWTVESHAGLSLPTLGRLTGRLNGVLGIARSAQANVVAPGHGYTYWNLGTELRIDRLVLDFRYWGTDVTNVDGYESRFVASTALLLD